jgi:excinuclease ABC subunit C
MVIMERLLLHQIDKQYLNGLPETMGVVSFYRADSLVFVSKTANVKRYLNLLYSQKNEVEEVERIFSQSDILFWDSYDTMLSALIAERLLMEKLQPELNHSIQPWKSYVYLALNQAEFPYIKIADFTEEDWTYLGPFRDRFFLMDMIDLMHKLLKLPYCEVSSGPCEKLDNGKCRGWCVLLKQDNDSEDNIQPNPHLIKLEALLKEAYLHPENGLLEFIQREQQKYEADLQFTKADLLTEQIDLLTRYREWLIFLYAAKQLSYESERISVQGCQLIRYQVGGEEFYSPYINIEYRENELLALNKNLLDDARILYHEWISNNKS